ncbi:MAG: hypothetical protein C0513_07370, partial [Isosphaera sp.]|nr:hypothetical protein [Isosphaera sp.]
MSATAASAQISYSSIGSTITENFNTVTTTGINPVTGLPVPVLVRGLPNGGTFIDVDGAGPTAPVALVGTPATAPTSFDFTTTGATAINLFVQGNQPNATIPGFFSFLNGGPRRVNVGDSTAGAFYSFGTDNFSNERSAGSIGSGTADYVSYGFILQNNTGATLTSFDLSFVQRQFRTNNATLDRTFFSWQVAPTAIVTGDVISVAQAPNAGIDAAGNFTPNTDLGLDSGNWDDFVNWNRVPSLDILPLLPSTSTGTPVPVPPAVPLSGVVTGINWTPGSFLHVRWYDFNTPETDQGLAVDDVVFSATNTLLPSVFQVDVSGPVAVADGTGNVTLTVDLTNQGNINGSAQVSFTLPPSVSFVSTSAGTAVVSGSLVTITVPVIGTTDPAPFQVVVDSAVEFPFSAPATFDFAVTPAATSLSTDSIQVVILLSPPPIEQDDIVVGLNIVDPFDTTRLVRGGTDLFNGFSADNNLQSFEFDNFGGNFAATDGALLGLRFGFPGDARLLAYSTSDTVSQSGTILGGFILDSDPSFPSFANGFNFFLGAPPYNAFSPTIPLTRSPLLGLSVNPSNSRVAFVTAGSADGGQGVIVVDYSNTAGNNPALGPNGAEVAVDFSSGFEASTAWIDDDTLVVASAIDTTPQSLIADPGDGIYLSLINVSSDTSSATFNSFIQLVPPGFNGDPVITGEPVPANPNSAGAISVDVVNAPNIPFLIVTASRFDGDTGPLTWVFAIEKPTDAGFAATNPIAVGQFGASVNTTFENDVLNNGDLISAQFIGTAGGLLIDRVPFNADPVLFLDPIANPGVPVFTDATITGTTEGGVGVASNISFV